MLAKRVIPCLDVDKGRVVKGVKFAQLRDAGDPVELASFYNREGADELVFYDITASHEERAIMLDVVHRCAEEVFIPLTVGGGVGSIDDMRKLLRAGADKVSVNTLAVEEPDLISVGANEFGTQCIVLAIDAKQKEGAGSNGKPQWEIYTHGGRTPTGLDAVDWCRRAQELGAGEITVNSIDRDGTQNGYDVALLRAINEVVTIPVVASGGAGEPKHFSEAITDGGADAVLAASLFHFGQLTVREVKQHLSEKGIPVRL